MRRSGPCATGRRTPLARSRIGDCRVEAGGDILLRAATRSPRGDPCAAPSSYCCCLRSASPRARPPIGSRMPRASSRAGFNPTRAIRSPTGTWDDPARPSRRTCDEAGPRLLLGRDLRLAQLARVEGRVLAADRGFAREDDQVMGHHPDMDDALDVARLDPRPGEFPEHAPVIALQADLDQD